MLMIVGDLCTKSSNMPNARKKNSCSIHNVLIDDDLPNVTTQPLVSMLFTKQTNGDEQGNVMRTIQRSINTSNMIDIIQINSVINVYLYCYDGCCAYVYNAAAMIMYRNSSNNGNTNNNNSNKNNINVNKVTSKLVIPSDHDYKYIYCYTNNYNGENPDALKSNSKSVSNLGSNAASYPFSESPQATVLPMITTPQLIARTDVNVALKLAVNLPSVISDDKETEIQGQDTEKGKGKGKHSSLT